MVYVLYIIENKNENEVIKKIEGVSNTLDMAHLYVYRQGGIPIYEYYGTWKSYWRLSKDMSENMQYVIEEFQLKD